MPDRRRATAVPVGVDPAAPATPYNALTASAEFIEATREDAPRYRAWQDEAWGYYDALGEFRFGVRWLENALSRIRLTAATQQHAGDEPAPLTSGPAVDAMDAFAGGIGGQAEVLGNLATQLSVPGEGWAVAEQDTTAEQNWCVKSADEIRLSQKKVRGLRPGQRVYEVREGPDAARDWRPLSPDSLVIRVYRKHKRRGWEADSLARAALPIMRQIDLADRRIIATIVSRLAANGILLYPEEATFKQDPQNPDMDALGALLIKAASNAIKNPGSAQAALPIPIRVKGELIELFRHLTFATDLDRRLLEERDKAIVRLATALDLPAEVLTGMGDVNHWGAWQLEEQAIKLFVSPLAEIICNAVSKGYLVPWLDVNGHPLVVEPGTVDQEAETDGTETQELPPGKIICWYDASELTVRPDRSSDAFQLHDRLELSGPALRRETGFAEEDAPDDEEAYLIAIKKIAMAAGADSLVAAEILKNGGDVEAAIESTQQAQPTDGGGAGGESTAPVPPSDERTPPDTRDNEPPPPNPQAAITPRPLTAKLVQVHTLVLNLHGEWHVEHPSDCEQLTCPVNWDVLDHEGIAPGTYGRYSLVLVNGRVALGPRTFDPPPDDHITSLIRRAQPRPAVAQLRRKVRA